MFLNKILILSVFTLFMTSGCVSIDTQSQQKQITNLQGELLESQKTNIKILGELTASSKALQNSQDKIERILLQIRSKNNKTNRTETLQINEKENSIRFDDKMIFGGLEWVYISNAKSNYKGRIDTGAATSSLNAINIERFERDGKKWVRFDLNHEKGNDSKQLEAKIVRIARIKQSSKLGKTDERPVVNLQVHIGNTVHTTEFTLTDRQHMEFPVLIGRSFMRDIVLVDVSQKYIYPKHQEK